MPVILAPGEHYGRVLQRWESPAFTLSEIRYAAGATYRPHGNAQGLLVFVEQGTYAKKVGRSELACDKNALLFIPPRRLQADVFGDRETTCLVVDCSAGFLARIHESGAAVSEAVLFSGSEFAGLGVQLAREFRQIDSVSALIFESLVLSILANGFRTFRSSLRPKPPSWLLRAKELMHDRFAESLTMESIAREAGVHPVHLSHEFRRFLQRTPGEYLRRIRVEFAARQLRETKFPLSRIATDSGFADQAHFSKTFRRIARCSPLEFRRQTKTN